MDDLERKVRELIEAEDKLRPLTDGRLAEMLGVAINAARAARAKIGSTSERREDYESDVIIPTIRKIVESEDIHDAITDEEISKRLRNNHGWRLPLSRVRALRSRAGLCTSVERQKKYNRFLT